MGASFVASPELAPGVRILCGAANPAASVPFFGKSRRRINLPPFLAANPLKDMANHVVLASKTSPVNSQRGSLQDARLPVLEVNCEAPFDNL
jgi:hypothetical protein